MDNGSLRSLQQLAGLYGITTTYRDYTGQIRQASPHALLATLGVLGASVAGAADIPDALHHRKFELWQRLCEPVTVCREGENSTLELRLKAHRCAGRLLCRLELEEGEPMEWSFEPAHLPVVKTEKVDGVNYIARRLPLPAGLPPGYHRLSIQFSDGICETTIISAPNRAYALPAGANRLWGVFVPLYALRSKESWAAGDVTDLETLHNWVRSLGGVLTGTLPLLAAFLDEPFDPSPYAPVSRMFWNEFYLDVTRIPELASCPPAQELLNSPVFQAEIEALGKAPLVDYRRGMAVKRRALELLTQCCFTGESARLAELRRWAALNPQAQDYARFRAAIIRQRSVWTQWPERLRSGDLKQGDFDLEAERYHLYVQWIAHQQFRELALRARKHGPGLYLDFPLGVHGSGYDVWRERNVFATGATCGAPPDRLNTGGQNWGFPPLHPDGLRQQAYRYFIAGLRHHLRHAGVLRLDHVMGMHRLFWIPAGLPAGEGVYVRYPAEEFYAILT
ncbi:MAG: 4-alpha-glucanotransferase, partial [Desulfotomaculaceae bacterium]